MASIGFYGAGNMAQAIIQGLLATGDYQREELLVYNHRYEPTLKKVVDRFQVTPILEEAQLFQQADVIIFAVKPHVLLAKLPQLAEWIQKDQLLISIAAGVTLQQMASLIGPHKLVRVMPNTPVTVNAGMSSVSGNEKVTAAELDQVVTIFESFGRAKVLPETQMSAVIGVSGSSPAYAYLFIEALADGGVLEGMSRQDAYEFAAQAVLGAAKMVLETGEHPAILKDQVCSPGGTTIEAVAALEAAGLRSAVIQAVRAAAQKNRELN